MKSKSNSESVTKNPVNAAKASDVSKASAPSVPISVYRELAAELQATKAMLDSINGQNQKLTQENQKLKQEIERFLHATLPLQQVMGITATPANLKSESPSSNAAEVVAETLRSQVARSPRPARPVAAPGEAETAPITFSGNEPAVRTDELFTAQEEPQLRTKAKPKAKDLGGVWLTLTIVVIMITAFGAGFLVVRPLLPKR